MGDTRFTNLALGKYANFFARTDSLIVPGDTTPDVTNGVLFFTNNTTNTTITNFDLIGVGSNPASQFEGKKIELVCLDTATTLQAGRFIFGQSANTSAEAPTLGQITSASTLQLGLGSKTSFVYHNSSWYVERSAEVGRSTTRVYQAASMGLDVTNLETVLVTATGAYLAVHRFEGGVAGQEVMLWVQATAGITNFISTSGGFISIAGTDALAMAMTCGYLFRCISTGLFTLVRPAA